MRPSFEDVLQAVAARLGEATAKYCAEYELSLRDRGLDEEEIRDEMRLLDSRLTNLVHAAIKDTLEGMDPAEIMTRH